MNYVVYVNHPNNKAFIHSTGCWKYIKRRRDKTIHGYWSDTFKSLEEAMSFAKNTNKSNIDTCSFCINN